MGWEQFGKVVVIILLFWVVIAFAGGALTAWLLGLVL